MWGFQYKLMAYIEQSDSILSRIIGQLSCTPPLGRIIGQLSGTPPLHYELLPVHIGPNHRSTISPSFALRTVTCTHWAES